MQACYLGTIEVQDCGPFTLAIGAPYDAATQKVSDRARRQVAVEIKKTGVHGLIACAQIEHHAGRVIFGRESEADAEVLRGGSCLLYLLREKFFTVTTASGFFT